MANLYITPYNRLAFDATGTAVIVGQEPSSATVAVLIDVASTQSAVLKAGTKFVRLHSKAECHIKFDVDPTATTADIPMAANQTEFFGVAADGLKIAVIQGA